jgi:hypothetical protein
MNPVLDHWEGKLRNWALWRLGGNGLGSTLAFDNTWGMCAPPPPPPLVGEALDTDDLVLKLLDEHRSVINAIYLWSVPSTLEARAAVLGIHPNTLHARHKAARFRLDDLDHVRRRAGLRPPPTVPMLIAA